MTQPTNTYDTYDTIGIREDLSDIITNVDPEETPFFTKTKKRNVTMTGPEWQTDALRDSAANAHIEGDDTTADARSPTVRLQNFTQIFKNAAVVSGTNEVVEAAGRGSEMDYQIMKTGLEQKLDIEKAMHLNNAKVAGDSSTARELGGIPTWVFTNTDAGAGATPSVGDGGTAWGAGTPRALTQTIFDTAMQNIWNSGGRPNTCYLPSAQMNPVLGFVGSNSQRGTIDATKTKVINMTDVYMTPWGTVEFRMNREMPVTDLTIVQDDKWEILNKRAMATENLAKTGDNEKKQVITELSLACLNEKASGQARDLS
jgi:hypothetical protein